jgi:predicted enzyme related to lactoylglutathione lyase
MSSKTRSSSKGVSDVQAAKKQKVDDAKDEPKTESVHLPFMPSKLDCAVVFTDDTKKSRQFWKDAFGFYSSEFESDEWSELKPGNTQKGSTTIGIHSTAKEKDIKSGEVHLSVSVKNIAQYHKHISGMPGVKVLLPPTKQPWGGMQAGYQAPDGTKFSAAEAPEKKQGSGICHIEIPVADTTRAKKFYSEVFGWTFKEYMNDYVMFDTKSEDYTVMGGLWKEPDSSKRIQQGTIHLDTPDIAATIEKAKANGGSVVKDKFPIPGVGFNAFVKDSEGNVIGLFSRE